MSTLPSRYSTRVAIPLTHRRHRLTTVDEAGVRSFERKVAVEGGDDRLRRPRGDLGRATIGDRGRLGESQQVGQVSPTGVDPGNTGDKLRVFGIASELGEQHRRLGPGPGRRRPPDALTGQAGMDQRLDRERPKRSVESSVAANTRPSAAIEAPGRPSTEPSMCSTSSRSARRLRCRRASASTRR
jgi:hypothetical protein